MKDTITTNRRAYYDYEVLDDLEAGIILQGTEIKAIRDKGMSLETAYVIIDKGEAWLIGSFIEGYEFGNLHNHNPTRKRKLLLHKSEIESWEAKMTQGMTIIPLNAHFTGGNVKITVGLARGKKLHDKRESLKEKDAQREIRKYE